MVPQMGAGSAATSFAIVAEVNLRQDRDRALTTYQSLGTRFIAMRDTQIIEEQFPRASALPMELGLKAAPTASCADLWLSTMASNEPTARCVPRAI